MKITIDDVNQQLFDQLRILNTELSAEDLATEIKKANAMSAIASTIIDSKRVQLDAYKLIKDGKFHKEELIGFIEN